jgi:adenylate cyclase class 2
MKNLEIEVKFFVINPDSMRRRILKLGAEHLGRFFESNLRFEDKNKTLLKNKSLLRLRKDNKATLTFKSPPPLDNHNFKILTELEVQVSDFATMGLILQALGFHPEQRYEKWRETFVLGKTHFCLDTMPFGNFIEIEGQKRSIRDSATRLGLKWENRILLNYLQLFDILRQKLNLAFHDVTFKNFKGLEVNVSTYADLFIAAPPAVDTS